MARIAAYALMVCLLGLTLGSARAQDSVRTDTPSGFPVPRFVSLKVDRVNVREGPSQGHPIAFVFLRKGLPIEVIAESEHWRRVRDRDGATGWIHQQMISGVRTLIVTGTANATLYAKPARDAIVVAYAQPGVILEIKSCDAHWCDVKADKLRGWIAREATYGLYPGETIE